MPDRIGAALNVATTVIHYLAGLPLGTQITGAATLVILLGYFEYRRRTRTTPTLKARAAHALAAGWKALRTTPTPEQKDRRGDRIELALVTFFVTVVAGLIMRGLIDFARDSMGLEGAWPYLLFAAFDGAAGLFAFASYRWALKHGASPLFPRLMVGLILGASAWFQWTHATAAGHPVAGQVAWAALPAIGAVLWEFVLRQRMKAWKKAQPPSTEQIPTPRWVLAPVQSAAMKRRMVLWGTDSYKKAVRLHVTRVQCIRLLRREFGVLWAWKVPADVAYQLKAGVDIPEAAEKVPEVIATHRREVEHRRLVKEAERAARAVTAPTPGVYTVSIPEAPVVDLAPVPGVADAVEPLEPTPTVEPTPARWVDPSDEWDPLPDEDEWENPTDPAPLTLDTPKQEEPPADPWDNALPANAEFTPIPAPALGTSPRTSVVVREPAPLLDDWEVPVLPTVNGRQITPKPGEPAFQAAVDLHLDCEKHNIELSGRELCRLNGVSPNNRLWCQAVIRAAKEQQAATTPLEDALF